MEPQWEFSLFCSLLFSRSSVGFSEAPVCDQCRHMCAMAAIVCLRCHDIASALSVDVMQNLHYCAKTCNIPQGEAGRRVPARD